METITYSQVQQLVKQLPTKKLPAAYSFLRELADKGPDALSPQLEFIRRPLAERRRMMAQQAEQMMAHYEQTAAERQEWQAGDFIDGS